ncbi:MULTISPECIES: hypothetical protein [unclassified Synechococcus]|uniref:hypothetical protein n=1 Tax=unclassified Synechococcus TaxID=2626047 RepID=UPI0000698386|nr:MULTISPECIES: hypothetical protein [unclassified Synechococcus]EAQ75829.1 hypothetical protein WH5701_03249 [Synechococcus sp. WH 5701]WFN59521.1 hypothetical protein N4320_02605 [Synechococcus sp. CCFWC 502]
MPGSRQHWLLGPHQACALGLHHALSGHRGQQLRSSSIQRLERRFQRRLIGLRLLRFSGLRSIPVPLIASLRALLSLVPLDAEAMGCGRGLLAQLNAPDLCALQGLGSSAERPLLAIVSCRQRLGKARQALQHFHHWERAGQGIPLIVVGDPTLPDWRFRFCPHQRLLQLPVDDAYEGLPHKVMALMLVASLLDQPPALLKMDDDTHPGDPEALMITLARLAQGEAVAAGYPIFTPSPLDLDRAWHMGKSARFNLRPFDSLGSERWMSGGVGYLLSASAVRQLGDFALHSWGFVQSMLYEDVCVSMLLQATHCPIHWLDDPSELGIGNERQLEIHQGFWQVPEHLR